MEVTIRPLFKQHLVYEALKTPTIDAVFFGGGAGGGKSWLICESRLINALRFPGYKSFIGRKELKRLMQSTYLTWQKVCQFHKIPQDSWRLNGSYNYIEFTNGSRIDLLDVDYLPSDPLYERFGSLEYTDGALEEAGEIHFLAYDVLKSRIGRHMNRELGLKPVMLITGNPKKNWTYQEFFKPWRDGKLPNNYAFIQALYMDNEFTAEEYGKQLSQIKDRASKERLMFGNWDYDDDPNTLIEYDAITDLFTNPIQESMDMYLVCDVARFGTDKTTISIWAGYKCIEANEYEKLSTDQVAQKIREASVRHQVSMSRIIVDEDGIGGGVVDQMKGIKGFIANTAPFENAFTHERENYSNLKAQCAYTLAEYVNNRKLAFITQNEAIKTRLSEELGQIKAKDPDKEGKLKIISKEEVKEMLGRSPDWSDNLLMRMYFELAPKQINNVPKTIYPHKKTQFSFKINDNTL